MPLRRLVLKKESLAELTNGELLSVAGAAPDYPTGAPVCWTLENVRCVPSQVMYPCVPTERCTNYC